MKSKNFHVYRDYSGPRLPGTKTTTRKVDGVGDDHGDEEEEENPLQALAWSEGDSLAPPCGSSVPLIHAMLDFGAVDRDDILYDLGCGDGRVLLEAAVKTKCQCVGVEIEADLVARGNELIEALPLAYREDKLAPSSAPDGMTSSKRIQVVHGDLRLMLQEFVWHFENEKGASDPCAPFKRSYETLPMPTVITLYLLPEGIAEIEDDLMKLLPHMRIVCCSWGLKGIRPIEEKDFHDQKTRAATTLYLYTKECFERLKGFEYMLTVYHQGH